MGGGGGRGRKWIRCQIRGPNIARLWPHRKSTHPVQSLVLALVEHFLFTFSKTLFNCITPAPPLFNQLWKVCYTIVDREAVNRSFVLRSRTAAQSVKQNFSSALYQLWARSAGPS